MRTAWNKKPTITRICECGSEFSFSEGALAWRNPMYCSRACRNTYFTGTGRQKHILPPGADDLIRKAYQEKVGMESCAKGKHPVRELAKKLGVPRWTISRRACHLGLIAKKKKEPDWTAPELKMLESQARFCPEVIQKKLKKIGYSRSIAGIMIKRNRMRFLKNLDGQSSCSLALCFGVDSKTITRWIKKGYLKAESRGTGRTEQQGGDMYYIKDKWVREFIIDSVDVVDFRKIDKYWLVDLLSNE
jgi:hypothetical protein